MAIYKTPGVYVEEIPAIPGSIVSAPTAVPAFIGYTEFAVDSAGNPLPLNTPTRITTLQEYEAHFGRGYQPTTYTAQLNSDNNNAFQSVTIDKRFYLYEAMRLFYANGGGECYIVSVGGYDKNIELTKLETGLDSLVKWDEPTLLLFPDAVGLKEGSDPDVANLGTLQAAALAQCETLKDRFVIMDVMEGYQEADFTYDGNIASPVAHFRQRIGVNNLKYGATYLPWLQTTHVYTVKFYQIELIDQNDDSIIPSISLTNAWMTEIHDNIITPIYTAISVNKPFDLQGNLHNSLFGDGEASPDQADLSLRRKHFQTLYASFYEVLEKELVEATDKDNALTNIFNFLRVLVQVFPTLEIPTANRGGDLQLIVEGAINSLKQDTNLHEAIKALVKIDIEKNVIAHSAYSGMFSAADSTSVWVGDLAFSDDDPNPKGILEQPKENFILIPNPDLDFSAASPLQVANALKPAAQQILASLSGFLTLAIEHEERAEAILFASDPIYSRIQKEIVQQLRTIPPSGAIAGVYAQVDRSRGVFKAPANVSLTAISGPSYLIDDEDQASLNVHPSGKSINAIRTFINKGTLVWGARTLAGNDNEWRYVSVRRFFIFVEESIQKALEPFVFEPNDINTWTNVRVMINNFLNAQWKAGALFGATPEEAYFVRIGLGETMTPEHILNGEMIVSIGMAAVRPAEFIILKFMHKLAQA